MDILGIGLPELIFILIIAMMIFGPRRLPEIAGKAGRIIAQLRGMSNTLLAEWQREINMSDQIAELKKAKEDIAQINQDLKQTRSEMKQAGKEVASGGDPSYVHRPIVQMPRDTKPAPSTSSAETDSESTRSSPVDVDVPAPDLSASSEENSISGGLKQSPKNEPANTASLGDAPTPSNGSHSTSKLADQDSDNSARQSKEAVSE